MHVFFQSGAHARRLRRTFMRWGYFRIKWLFSRPWRRLLTGTSRQILFSENMTTWMAFRKVYKALRFTGVYACAWCTYRAMIDMALWAEIHAQAFYLASWKDWMSTSISRSLHAKSVDICQSYCQSTPMALQTQMSLPTESVKVLYLHRSLRNIRVLPWSKGFLFGTRCTISSLE